MENLWSKWDQTQICYLLPPSRNMTDIVKGKSILNTTKSRKSFFHRLSSFFLFQVQMDELEEHKIETWRGKCFKFIGADCR